MQKSSFLVGHVSFWQAQALTCILDKMGAMGNGPSLGAEQGRGEGRRRKNRGISSFLSPLLSPSILKSLLGAHEQK